MNNTTCAETYSQYNDSSCPTMFDGYLCWPSTAPGNNISQDCPQLEGLISGAKAYKICKEDGKWEQVGEKQSYTHYEGCMLPQILDLLEMCKEIQECPQIIRTTRIIEMVGLSLSSISLLVSLFIFFQYRVLKNNRTKIHKNLFIATLMQVVVRLILYVDQEIPAKDRVIEGNPALDVACKTLLEYTKTAMFMWMFIEGLYLHNVITARVFQEHSYIKLYFYVGWTAPAFMTVIWLVTMLVFESKWKYYYFLNYYWILEGPRCIIIVINKLFLINIIRVLIVKLRQSHTSEIEQVRKAVRAAIFLLPLMGIANVFFWTDLRFKEAWKFALWIYTTYFLNTFQGFFVAILYCFLNGEVQTAVKNSFYLHMSLRKHDYAPCRNLTLISMAADTDQPNENTRSSWMGHCLRHIRKSPQEKDINICDLNGRRNSAIVTELTMVETKPLRRADNQNSTRISMDDTDSTIIEDKGTETKV